MSERRSDSAENRKPWSWPVRVLYWLYGFILGPFLTKHDDGRVTGAMTRWAVAAFTVAMYQRLTTAMDKPLGWAETFAVFFILFALPIDGAMTALAKRNPAKLIESVTGMFGKGDEGSTSRSWSRSSSSGYERPDDLALDSDPGFSEKDEPT